MSPAGIAERIKFKNINITSINDEKLNNILIYVCGFSMVCGVFFKLENSFERKINF